MQLIAENAYDEYALQQAVRTPAQRNECLWPGSQRG